MTSSVRAKRAADQKAANRREEEMRLAKLEGRILEAEEIVKKEAPEAPVAERAAFTAWLQSKIGSGCSNKSEYVSRVA